MTDIIVMKTIITDGIYYLEPLRGSAEWYWGMDYTSGDLYEAEELFRDGNPIRQNRLIFIHRMEGRVVEPIRAKEGQYFGRPEYDNGRLIILLVDFPAEEIHLFAYDDAIGKTEPIVTVPLSEVEDCYNLMPKRAPLMLTRQSADNRFQIVWPEKVDFAIGSAEAFCFRDGDRLYFSRWYEDPDYREEVVVRKLNTGEIVEQYPGALFAMPDGQMWVLK